MIIPLTPLRFLRYSAQQYPHRTAVVCGDLRFTYTEFADRTARLGGALRALGVQPGERVAYLSANCHRLLEGYFGVLEAGAVLLPLNIRLAPQELAYILNDSETSVVLFEEQFTPLVDALRKELKSVRTFVPLDFTPAAPWMCPQNYEGLLAAATPYRTDVMQVDENSLAELFYTSGTSANPKGVMLTHRNIYLHALNVAITFPGNSDSVELHTIPLFHANGWGVAHSLTYVGGKHVMMRKFETTEVFRLIEREGAQSLSVVPAMATALVNCPDRPKVQFEKPAADEPWRRGFFAHSDQRSGREARLRLLLRLRPYGNCARPDHSPHEGRSRLAGADRDMKSRPAPATRSPVWRYASSIPREKTFPVTARALARSWPAVTV